MKKSPWTPSEEVIKNANMIRFIEYVNRKYGKNFKVYDDLYQWSIENIPVFLMKVLSPHQVPKSLPSAE